MSGFRAWMTAGVAAVTEVSMSKSLKLRPTDEILGTLPEELQRLSTFFEEEEAKHSAHVKEMLSQYGSEELLPPEIDRELMIQSERILLTQKILVQEIREVFDTVEKGTEPGDKLLVKEGFTVIRYRADSMESRMIDLIAKMGFVPEETHSMME